MVKNFIWKSSFFGHFYCTCHITISFYNAICNNFATKKDIWQQKVAHLLSEKTSDGRQQPFAVGYLFWQQYLCCLQSLPLAVVSDGKRFPLENFSTATTTNSSICHWKKLPADAVTFFHGKCYYQFW